MARFDLQMVSIPLAWVAIVTIGLLGTAARSATNRRRRDGDDLAFAAAMLSRRRSPGLRFRRLSHATRERQQAIRCGFTCNNLTADRNQFVTAPRSHP